MRLRRPKTLLSLTLVGLGLVTLPLLIGVGNAFFKLNELMQESGLAVEASRESTRVNARAAQTLTDLQRHGSQYLAFTDAELRADALRRYRDAAGNMAQTLAALRAMQEVVHGSDG